MVHQADVNGAGNLRSIVTLTVNPALDVSTSTERVLSGHKMRCAATRLDPGGGGINVARVIQRLGGRTLSIYAAGGPTGKAYRQLIEAAHIPALVVPILGSTRESFTVDETSTGKQFRFVLQGPELREDEWRACLELLSETIVPGGFLVASGSLPPGVPTDFYARVARIARSRSVQCAVDAGGSALAEALTEGVFLVKPSRHELEEYLGARLDSEQSQLDAISRLVSQGGAEYVALTLGASGAVLASAAGIIRIPAPDVTVQSTVGAGDSFLGALVLRLAQGHPMDHAFRAGVAAGSATAMTPATELCAREDVERLEAELASR